MNTNHPKTLPTLAATTLTLTILAFLAPTANARPVKLVPSGEIKTGQLGSFYLEGVAVLNDKPASPAHGNVYLTDRGGNRVLELTPGGQLVLMFGKEVNATTKGDICTAASGNTCKAGVEGTGAGAFTEAQALAVDPATGDIYVQDVANSRVDKYTAGGEFVLMFGKEVNETKVKAFKGTPTPTELEEASICTAVSKDVCQTGVRSETGSTEHGAFSFLTFTGTVLAVGLGGRVFVGGDERVQEFGPQGEWQNEIGPAVFNSATGCNPSQLHCGVVAMAVDASGDVYLTDRTGTSIVREFGPTGLKINEFTVSPRNAGDEVGIEALTLDFEGHLAVSAEEVEPAPGISRTRFGTLFDAASGHLVTRFSLPPSFNPFAMAFNDNSKQNELYLANGVGSEVLVYKPVNVAELTPTPVSCVPGDEDSASADVTLACQLNGSVNPWGVGSTEVWFEWGRTAALGERTPTQSILTSEVPTPMSVGVGAVRPNEAGLFYRLAGFDANAPSSEEPLTSASVSFPTPITAPRIVGGISTPAVRSASAVLFGELNPENAATKYRFQYGPCKENNAAKCPESPYSLETGALQSGVYGNIGVTQEITGLQPATVYHYRLVAESESRDKIEKLTSLEGPRPGSENNFTTNLAPSVQAETTVANGITATSAIVSGTVNPDGQPAAYGFEVGVYAGATTQYGIVFSGPAGSSSTPIAKSLVLTGLQPGTRYAYRITIKSGYGTATGETLTFVTAGLPAILPVPATPPMLAVPQKITFPKSSPPGKGVRAKCKKGYTLSKAGKCVKSKKPAKGRARGRKKR